MLLDSNEAEFSEVIHGTSQAIKRTVVFSAWVWLGIKKSATRVEQEKEKRKNLRQQLLHNTISGHNLKSRQVVANFRRCHNREKFDVKKN